MKSFLKTWLNVAFNIGCGLLGLYLGFHAADYIDKHIGTTAFLSIAVVLLITLMAIGLELAKRGRGQK